MFYAISLLLFSFLYHCGTMNGNDNEFNTDYSFCPVAFWTCLQVLFVHVRHKMGNHPVYWRLMGIVFHIIMGFWYCMGIIWDTISYELFLWSFFMISFILPLVGPIVYTTIVINIFISLMLSSLSPSKSYKCKPKKSYCQKGFCKSRMILSEYMNSLCWTGYLRKTGN